MLRSIDYNKVADIYDDYVNVDFDIPFWLQEAGKAKGKVLELTSGTGRISIPLLRAGINLMCVDYSTEMLSRLQRKVVSAGLSCKTVPMDIAELSLAEQFELIFIPFNSFSEILEPARHKQAFERISAHLADSGQFICTLHNPKIRLSTIDGTTGTLGRFPILSGGSLMVRHQLSYDSRTHIAKGLQYYDLCDENEKVVEQRSLGVEFYLFQKREFEDLARSSGFDIVDLYGNYDCSCFVEETSPFMIWRLRKLMAPSA
jgi:SAM-dependent methyltransferase